MKQLAIDFAASPSFRPEDFVVSPSNRPAYEAVTAWPHWKDRILWVCGPEASGKTHLAHVWAHRSHARYLSFDALAPDTLENAPQDNFGAHNALVLDCASGHAALPEAALFHLINYVRNEHRWLLVAHPLPPSRLNVQLPDLRSRLNALPLATLAEPDDMLLEALIIKQFSDRQLTIEPDVVTYLVARAERSAAAIARLIADIDATALAHQRRITLPFIRQLLTQP